MRDSVAPHGWQQQEALPPWPEGARGGVVLEPERLAAASERDPALGEIGSQPLPPNRAKTKERSTLCPFSGRPGYASASHWPHPNCRQMFRRYILLRRPAEVK